MIIDFKDLLIKHYLDNEFDIPMIADVVEAGTVEFSRVVETMLITSAAVRSAVDAGLDPMMFSIINRDEYMSGGMLFYEGTDEEYEYQLAGSISQTAFEGSYQEGWIQPVGNTEPHPVVDVMRKTPGTDHWQIWNEDMWLDNGPPVGFLERMNETLNDRTEVQDG